MKLDTEEKELLNAVERGEWLSVYPSRRAFEQDRAQLAKAAKAALRKDRRVNIRISSRDLEAIQKRALAEALPYQTLMASVLHLFAVGRLRGRRAVD